MDGALSKVEPELCRDKLFFQACRGQTILPENVCVFNLSSISIVCTFFHSFYCILLRQMLSLDWNIKPQFQPPLSPAPSRSPRPPQSLHPPGWNRCSCVAPPPLQ